VGQIREGRGGGGTDALGWVLIGAGTGVQADVDHVLSGLEHRLVDVRRGPYRYRYALLRGQVDSFGDLPAMRLSEPLIGWRRALKRACDVAVSSTLLVLSAPALAGIALAIRLTSRGPALYWQDRLGPGGRVFKLAKFRTMHRDAERETGPVWAEANDPRCTAIGRLLRRTSMDELPQLWNVLTGDMSLVGPRPERPVFVERFSAELPNYTLRHSVKGGMTGWAQVNGWRGATSLDERLRHDLDYIRNWSPLLDARILWMTVAGGFLNRHGY
jgi:exopolysaccharide biosynthesis polyprenyl glycosylphosphotransferase